jgi:hypothetical protein
MGLLGFTMARIHHFKSHLGDDNDPYRWSFYDKLDSQYRQNGVSIHQINTLRPLFGKEIRETEKMVREAVCITKTRPVFYAGRGRRQRRLKRGGDGKHVDEFIQHFKAAQKTIKMFLMCQGGAGASQLVLHVYGIYESWKKIEFILKWLNELKGLYDYFPYQIRGG